MIPQNIRELDDLSLLEGLADEYEQEFGQPPFDISHWDPSPQNTNALFKHLRFPVSPPAVPYIYSCDLDTELQRNVVQRLGLPADDFECLIVPNGTTAILFAAWWLRAIGVTRLVVLCPVYFPVFYACEIVGVTTERCYMKWQGGSWCLPEDDILRAFANDGESTAIWVTNPIYCTGTYLGAADLEFLKSLANRGIVMVADECLALNGKEVSRAIGRPERFLGLFSPHKSVCINAVKFAAIAFDTKHRRFFDTWADVLIGGLSSSHLLAVQHFLDANFLEFQEAFVTRLAVVRKTVIEAVRKFQPPFQLDDFPDGYFMTCYAPTLASSFSETFLRQLIFETGTILIPGSRNHFPPDAGFNFRINLARESPQFVASLQRTIRYIAQQSGA